MNRRKFLQAGSMAALGPRGALTGIINPGMQSSPKNRDFVHPGVLQTTADLERMATMLKASRGPVSAAWQRMLKLPEASLEFDPHPCAHIFRGGGGIDRLGADELRASGQAAHFHAMQWYVSRDARHARKVIEILDAWSSSLWTFSGNDAKLLAGWVGGYLCNAAEIVASTYTDWDPARHGRFKTMLAEVFVPLLRPFFPEANGNWDGAIMFSLAAIAIHLEDSELFERVVRHYFYGTGNAGILKYVWPNGQCEESTRDQGHTQLGLGYFSYAAQVLWSQGVDAFGAGDNRLASGFEYTSAYMLGENVPHFGEISERGRGSFDDYYESVLAHFASVKHLNMEKTRQAAERARARGALSTLWFYRGSEQEEAVGLRPPVSTVARAAGASQATVQLTADGWTSVPAGDALDRLLASQQVGPRKLFLLPGVHSLTRPVSLTSDLTIKGSGKTSILHLSSTVHDFCLKQSQPELSEVSLSDFVIEGDPSVEWPSDPNEAKRHRSSPLAEQRGGLLLSGDRDGQIQNIRLERLTIRNCTLSGVAVYGAINVRITGCDFSDSGGSGAPGPELHHNLVLQHVRDCEISGTRLSGSMWGSGLAAVRTDELMIKNTEVSRNARFGLEFLSCSGVRIMSSLIEANDQGAYASDGAGDIRLNLIDMTLTLNGGSGQS